MSCGAARAGTCAARVLRGGANRGRALGCAAQAGSGGGGGWRGIHALDEGGLEEEAIALSAVERTRVGTRASEAARKEGLLPAAVMAFKTNRRETVALEAREMDKLLRQHRSDFLLSRVVHLHVKGGDALARWSEGRDPSGKSHIVRAIMRQVIFHSVKNHVLNVTLQHCPRDAQINVRLPLKIVGQDVCPGQKRGGVLYRILDYLECVCDTNNIPHHVELDISKLNVGQSVRVRHVALPEGILKVKPGPEEVIAKVVKK